MSNNDGSGNSHLQVPDSSFASINTGRQTGDGTTGRPRSGSNRSNTSQSPRNSLAEASDLVNPYDIRTPSIRIAHQPSRGSLRDGGFSPGQHSERGSYFSLGYLNPARIGRNRSNSEPVRAGEPGAASTPGVASGRRQSYMPGIEEVSPIPSEGNQQDAINPVSDVQDYAPRVPTPRLRHAQTNIHEHRNRRSRENEYESNLVDLLDVVDPEVSTLTTLTNVQNSLFVPSLGRFVNRRPTYTLTRTPSSDGTSSTDDDGPRIDKPLPPRPDIEREPSQATLNTITSRVQDKYYAVLPHGVRLEGWSEEDKLELNDHVRHMLHSRRSKFRRRMKGFGQYVRKPLGFFVTLYAVLITLFGLAWVLFLIGWINVGGRKEYLVHVIDSVLVALFAIVGDGLAPFRVVDTYHMCFIAHYHHLTWRLRKEQSLPALQNKSDLPSLPPTSDEAANSSDPSVAEKGLPQREFSVLTEEQQRKLEHHQKKFSKSHSFYKPHETYTHHAFSLRLLVAVVVLLDVHSLLQISLGACTWGIDYRVRPFALTTVILCCSITVNITAGILISVGDHRSRKKDVIERLFRQQLTEEAMRKVERRREKQVRKELEARGVEGNDEIVKQYVSPPPIVLERTSMEVRRELERKKVNRDAGLEGAGEMRKYISPPLEEDAAVAGPSMSPSPGRQ